MPRLAPRWFSNPPPRRPTCGLLPKGVLCGVRPGPREEAGSRDHHRDAVLHAARRPGDQSRGGAVRSG
eukprot:scaffold18104_cov114-Isochrysis_galbana.AAC.4